MLFKGLRNLISDSRQIRRSHFASNSYRRLSINCQRSHNYEPSHFKCRANANTLKSQNLKN